MATILRLTVLTGPHKNDKFCFCGPSRCLIGRGEDCFVQLVGTWRDRFISRRHCELVLDPPVITLNALSSQNGTYLNGARIESLEWMLTPKEDGAGLETRSTLHQGDLLTIGGTTLRVDLVECPPANHLPKEAVFWEKGEVKTKACPIPCP